jgi:hypothetical protein
VTERRLVVAHGEQQQAGERRVRPPGDDDRREARAIRPVPCLRERNVLKRGGPRACFVKGAPRVPERWALDQRERGVPSMNLQSRAEVVVEVMASTGRAAAQIPSYTGHEAAPEAATRVGRRDLPERRVLY